MILPSKTAVDFKKITTLFDIEIYLTRNETKLLSFFKGINPIFDYILHGNRL
jgi:hypothetical protein